MRSRHSDSEWSRSEARSKISGAAMSIVCTTTDPIQQPDISSGNNHSSDTSKRVSWKSQQPQGDINTADMSESDRIRNAETIRHANGNAIEDSIQKLFDAGNIRQM